MTPPSQPKLSPEKYARLKAEAIAPYRGLRKFLYFGLGASALIGGIIFLLQLLAGRGSVETLPNLALQIGVFTLMLWLFRRESDPKK
ncbi:MAG: DUF3493 domain-containing protein [Snowella sp.]|nr:DUF3493 domain-containing protein [Snowella sp.]